MKTKTYSAGVLLIAILLFFGCDQQRTEDTSVADSGSASEESANRGTPVDGEDEIVPEKVETIIAATPRPKIQLAIKNINRYPTRITKTPGGEYYVSNAQTNSVFIYNNSLQVIGELTGLNKPIGVVSDKDGNLFVANYGAGNVVFYQMDLVSMTAEKVYTIVKNIQTPFDLALDDAGRLYVANLGSNRVSVYKSKGKWITHIGVGDGMDRPRTLALEYRVDTKGKKRGELYVADKQSVVRVYDLKGELLRTFGSSFAAGRLLDRNWQGKFVSINGLALDESGRLHVLDAGLNNVQIVDAITGSYTNHYAQTGQAEGQLLSPFGMVLDGPSRSIVTNTGNRRLEVFEF